MDKHEVSRALEAASHMLAAAAKEVLVSGAMWNWREHVSEAIARAQFAKDMAEKEIS